MGAYLEKTTLKSQEVNQSNVVFRPAGYEHENTFLKRGGVCFNVELINSPELDVTNTEPHTFFPSIYFLRLISGSLHHLPSDEVQCRLEEFICNYNFLRIKKEFPNLISKIKDYIRSNHREELSLSMIAKGVGYDPSYISRLFKKWEHITVGDYIRQVRLSYAYIEMWNNDQKLTRIAVSNGFYDQAHFIKSFQQAFDTLPSSERGLLKKSI